MVIPERVPAWLLEFAASARQCTWMDLVVLPVAEVELPRSPRPAADVRAFLAMERAHHGRIQDTGLLSGVAIATRRSVTDALVPGRIVADLAGLEAEVAALSPDVILLAGTQAWGESLAPHAEWGCWSLDATLLDATYGGLPLLAPILNGESATLVGLSLDCGDGVSLSLGGGCGATHSSFTLQRESGFSKVTALLVRALRKLATGDLRLPPRQAGVLALVSTPVLSQIGLGVRATAIGLRAAVKWQIKKRRHGDSWSVLLRTDDASIDPTTPELGSNLVISAPRDDYWADPCAVDADGRRLIFLEEYGVRRAAGVIACVELFADGSAQRLGIALDEPFHLSYPQVFFWDGHWYMTVESSAARRVSLYRCTGFPLRWERVADLISGCVCVDGTLHHHDGHWYLFVNISENGGSSCDELFLFVSEELTGPYTPHPENPVVTDVRRARPAGRLFHRDGRLVRPSQDCGPDYGAAIVFNHVVELSPTRYREVPMARLDPVRALGMRGCHTYSSTSTMEVLDSYGCLSDRMQRIPVSHASPDRHPSPGGQPLLSVIVLANGDDQVAVAAAVQSVLGQPYDDLEILVVVGNPEDAGLVVHHYPASFDAGCPGSDATGQAGRRMLPSEVLSACNGRYISVLCAGRAWPPGYAFACIAALERDAGLGYVYAVSEAATASPGCANATDGGDASKSRSYAEAASARDIGHGIAIIRRSIAHSCGALELMDRLVDAPVGTMHEVLSRVSQVSDVGCLSCVPTSGLGTVDWAPGDVTLDDTSQSIATSDEFAEWGAGALYVATKPQADAAIVPRQGNAADDGMRRRCLDVVNGIVEIARQTVGLPVRRASRESGPVVTRGDGGAPATHDSPPIQREVEAFATVPMVGIGIHYLRYSTANLLVFAAGFISFPVLTRLLDNAQYGILGYFEAWVAVAVAVAKLGTQHSLVRFYPFQASPEKLLHFNTNLVALPVAISLSLWGIVGIVLGAFSIATQAPFSAVFWCAFASIPLLVLASVIEMILRASERSLLLTVTRVAKRWLELVLVLGAVIVLQQTALAVYWGRLAAAVLVVGYCIHWVRGNLGFSRKLIDVPAMLDSWRYGMPLVANEIAFIVLISVDRVMLKHITGDFVAVGIYTIGYALAMQINVLMQASLYEAFVPVANRTHDVDGDSGVRALKARILRPMTYASIGIAALILCVGNDAMVALSGPTKIASGPVFVVIGMTFALYPLVDIAGYGLLLQKRSMLVLSSTFAAAVLNILLNLVLIPLYGVMGAVMATTASYSLLGAIKYALCPASLRVLPEARTVLVACASAAAFLVVVKFGNVLGGISTWPRLFLSGVLFVVIYGLPVWILDPTLRGLVSADREPRFV